MIEPLCRPHNTRARLGLTVNVGNLKSYGKTREIEVNNKVELCYVDDDHNQVRITGKAEVVKDRKLMEDIWNSNRLLQHYLGSIDNPELNCLQSYSRRSDLW